MKRTLDKYIQVLSAASIGIARLTDLRVQVLKVGGKSWIANACCKLHIVDMDAYVFVC